MSYSLSCEGWKKQRRNAGNLLESNQWILQDKCFHKRSPGQVSPRYHLYPQALASHAHNGGLWFLTWVRFPAWTFLVLIAVIKGRCWHFRSLRCSTLDVGEILMTWFDSLDWPRLSGLAWREVLQEWEANTPLSQHPKDFVQDNQTPPSC